VTAIVPTVALATLLVASSHHIGLVARRFAEQHGAAMGVRWFAMPVALPEVDVCLQWHARLDHDPAQRWLRSLIHTSLDRGLARPATVSEL